MVAETRPTRPDFNDFIFMAELTKNENTFEAHLNAVAMSLTDFVTSTNPPEYALMKGTTAVLEVDRTAGR